MRPIVSRLSCNCVPKLMKYAGTNGMGQKVYKNQIGKPCNISSKLVKKKQNEKEVLVRQYKLYTVPQGWAVGDVLVIQGGERITIESIEGDKMLEVIAYGGNTNASDVE